LRHEITLTTGVGSSVLIRRKIVIYDIVDPD